MLGLRISDPDGVESATQVTTGLSLLPVTTRFLPAKSTYQIRARVAQGRGILARAEGAPICGYEIHMGQTEAANSGPAFVLTQRSSQPYAGFDGCLSADGNVLGTYIHGLFHNEQFRHAVLRALAARKGKPFLPNDSLFSADEQYDRLAARVKNNLDMELIRKLIDRC
jgi:adenosylcobyric acid synthase